MKIKPLLHPVFLLLAGSFVASCQQTQLEEETDQPSACLTEAQITALAPMPVEDTVVVERLRLNGQVNYNPNTVVPYMSFVSGSVTQTFFSLGDQVRKGQLLAEIQSADLNEMETQITQLEVQLQVAERELEKQEGFFKDNIASQKELLAAQSEKASLQAEIDKIKSNLELFTPSSQAGKYQILSPRNGFVVQNRMVTGMRFAADSDPLFTVSDINQVWIELNVYPTNISFVKTGMPAEIELPDESGQNIRGEISYVSSIIDPGERVLKARVILENKNLFLKPGLNVQAVLEKRTAGEAPRLPAKAVVFHNNAYYAVVIHDCKTENRELKILSQDEFGYYVESGLEKGEKIATQDVLTQFQAGLQRENGN